MGKQIELIGREPGDDFLNRSEDPVPSVRRSSSLGRLLVVFVFGFSFCLCLLKLFGQIPSGRVPVFSSYSLASQWNAFHYEREVFLSDRLANFSAIIEGHLPWTDGNLSWNLHLAELDERLSEIPFLLSPKVTRCSWRSFRCFKIDAELKRPRIVASLKGAQWFVDDDGRFLGTANEEDGWSVEMPVDDFPQVSGLEMYGSSPTLLRDATSRVIQVVDALEEESGREVASVQIRDDAQLQIALRHFETPFIIGAEQLGTGELHSIGQKISSILKLPEVSLESRNIEYIDLRYRDMAVLAKAQLDPNEIGGEEPK